MHIFPSFSAFTLCFSIIQVFIASCDSFRCIHDSLNVNGIPAIAYQPNKVRVSRQKHFNDPLFEPLKLHVYIDYIDPRITENALFNIRLSLEKISHEMSLLLQVKKGEKPFLLDRTCLRVWTYGANLQRCSRLNSEPEQCKVDDIPYFIPSAFLKGIEVFDFADGTPRYVIEAGSGVPDANFILFVVSRSSALCKKDIQAYGSYCRTTRNSKRPTAGLINICPDYFSQRIFNGNHYYNVLLHEVFHILGFSDKLFAKFRLCSPGVYCDIPKSYIQTDQYGIDRLLFPLVVKNMQIHLNCYKADFGAPLDSEIISNLTKYVSKSHWHPVLMYGSIMTPYFSESDNVIIDNITLAVFASTGWYKVNFSRAEPFFFGKDGGCDFGVTNRSCNESEQICLLNANSTQKKHCDASRISITHCSGLKPNFTCGVYTFNAQEACMPDYESIVKVRRLVGLERRCLMIQARNDPPEPTCLFVKYLTKGIYSVLVDSKWVPCPFSQVVQQNNYTLYCPPELPYIEDNEAAIKPVPCTEDDKFVISIRMYLQKPSFNVLIANNNFKNLKVTAIQVIANALEIPVNAIVNATLSTFKKTYLDFSVCPLNIAKGEDLIALVKRIQTFLDQNMFVSILKGSMDLIIASTDVKLDPEDIFDFSDHEGFKVLISLPVVFSIFLLATCFASLIRLYLIQQHRPRRALETEAAVQNSTSEAQIPPTHVVI